MTGGRSKLGGVNDILRPPPCRIRSLWRNRPDGEYSKALQLPVSCHPGGLAHYSGLGPLIHPQFPAEIEASAPHFPVGAHPSSRRGGNHFARCKAASPADALG